MLIKVLVRLPDYSVLPLMMVLSAETRGLHMKEAVQTSLCKHGQSSLEVDRMRLVYKGSEILDAVPLLDVGFPTSTAEAEEPFPTVELVVKMAERTLAAPRLFEYREFVRQVIPTDGAINVPRNTLIRLRLGCNAGGYSLSLPHLRDSSSCSSSEPHFGDILAHMKGDTAAARDKGLVQWTNKKFHQRVLLLEVDPSTASLLFPKKKSSTRNSSKSSSNHSRYLDSRRYWHAGINAGYIGGDVHSWQRYTVTAPIDCSISETRWPVEGLTEPAYPTVPLPVSSFVDKDDVDSEGLDLPDSALPLCTHTFASYSIADEVASTAILTLKPVEPLKPETLYAILLMNSVPTVPAGDVEANWSAWAATGLVAEDALYSFVTGT